MEKEEIQKEINWLLREMQNMFEADKKKAKRELAIWRKMLKTAK